MTKQFKQLEKNEKCSTSLPFAFDDSKGKVTIPDEIHLIPIGEWMHDAYGPMIINSADIREFAQNFNQGIRKGVFITAGHEGWTEQPAVGWITKVEAKSDGLWGTVEWNEFGKGVLTDKQWKFFSPELVRDYEDPQTHDLYRNVLTGGALTKSPYFKELQAIVFSEKNLKGNFNDTNMNLQELLAKDITTLSDEEKAFIKAHASELTEEQKLSHTAIIDEPAPDTETDEEKAAREAKEKADGAAAAADDGDPGDGAGDGAGKQDMSEKNMVKISASELAILRAQADKGAQAFKELENNKLDALTSQLIFTEANKAGRFLPKSQGNLRAFMETLNTAQRAKFSELVAAIPKGLAFNEEGADGAIDGSAQMEVDAKIAKKMESNKNLKYSEALKEVMAENEGLEQRYDEGLTPVRAAK